MRTQQSMAHSLRSLDDDESQDQINSLPWSLRTRNNTKKHKRNEDFSRVLETKKRFNGFDDEILDDEMSVQDSESDDEASSDEDENDYLPWSLRTGNKEKNRNRDFEDSSTRVLETRKRFKGFEETLDGEMGIQDSDFDDVVDAESTGDLEEDVQPEISGDEDVGDDDDDDYDECSAAIERFSVGDVVWAKALPYTWWPGWICKKHRFRVLISFCGHKRPQKFKVSEIRPFDKQLSPVQKLVPRSFLDTVDCNLAELGRRMVLGLMSPCEGSSTEVVNSGQQHLVKKGVKVKKVNFQPRAVLEFVLRMAVCAWVDDEEIMSVVKSGAQVGAFRRYVFVENDSLYRESMRLSESGLTSDDDSDEAIMMTEEAKFSEEKQVDKPEVLTRQVETDLGICEKDRVEPLHEFLTYLHCLALDPFYAGPEGSSSTCRTILGYRKLVYSKVLVKVPVKCIPEEEQEGEPEVLTRQAEKDSGICKIDEVEPLYEFLTYLRCLALDPFYVGPEGSSSMRQKILNCRKLLFCKVLDEVPVKHASDHSNDVKIRVVPENSRLYSVLHLNHATARTLSEKNVGTRRTDGTRVSQLISNVPIQHYNMAGSSEKGKDVMVDCTSTSMGNPSDLDPAFKDSIAFVKDIPDHDIEALTDKAQEFIKVEETVAHLINTVTRTEHGYSFADDTHGCHLSSHGQEYTNKNNFDDNTMDVKDDCSVGFMAEVSPKESVVKDSIKTHSDESVDVAKSVSSESLSSLGDDHIMIHPGNNIGAADNITDPEVILETVSEDNCKGKKSPSQPAYFGLVPDFQEEQSSYPHSPVSIGNTRFQSSTTNSILNQPTTLHMKFPKDFKLPSKEELVKKFCQFGRLDSSRTKIFFFTGSAQLVFLSKLDAEAAYHFATRKKIFLGQANVRFWLDKHENSRRRTMKIPSPSSFSTVGSSALNLKSCLRKSSNAPGRKYEVERKRVKFLPVSQVFSSPSSMIKSRASILSDSCKFSSEVRPDISVQMLALLDKCNLLVCKTKDNLGLQSYYSMFTYNYSDIPNPDDE